MAPAAAARLAPPNHRSHPSGHGTRRKKNSEPTATASARLFACFFFFWRQSHFFVFRQGVSSFGRQGDSGTLLEIQLRSFTQNFGEEMARPGPRDRPRPSFLEIDLAWAQLRLVGEAEPLHRPAAGVGGLGLLDTQRMTEDEGRVGSCLKEPSSECIYTVSRGLVLQMYACLGFKWVSSGG